MTKRNASKYIHLYTSYWSTFGGGEKYVLLLADALAKLPDVSVTLLSSEPRITKTQLEQFVGTRLENIEYRVIRNRNEIKSSTEGTDLFVCLSNFRTVTSSARRHIQLLQIPYGRISARTVLGRLARAQMKEAAKDLLRLQLLRFSRERADLVVTNSRFVQQTLQRNFRVASQVLHPPIQDFAKEGFSRKNVILSVGRFFRGLYNEKRYDVLTEAFRQVSRSELAGWEYHIVGNAGEDRTTRDCLHELQEANRGYPVYFHVNEPYESLVRLYNEAAIFWHAAGYGVDETRDPERVEHFGMTTAEAMSAGCIPVVINKGGQREIVAHGVDGFLWQTTDDLLEQTVRIARGVVPVQQLRQRCAQAL